tara:strand:- start:813 stop:1526 length:714 start_codon:yes stop_codon:yes gene_type:complete
MTNCKILGVIPARGGSKGIPKKNLVNLGGKPLIAHTIECAKSAKLLTDFIISTDDNEISKVSETFGGKVPFLRPKNLATDSALSTSVIKHALKKMEEIKNIKYDYVMMLQPTSPFRKSTDIDSSIDMIINSNADSLISVVDVEGNHPFRMKRITGKNKLVNFIDQGFEDMRSRQELPKVYIRSGTIYLSKRELILNNNSFVGENCIAYTIPNERSVNIDTELDLMLAKTLFKSKSIE